MKKTRLVIATTLLATLILLVLGGALLVPHAFAGSFPPYDSPPSLVTSSTIPPLSNGSLTNGINDWTTNESFSTATRGETFYVYVDVINVTQLFGYQVGFTFNQTMLQVTNITDTGWLTAAGGTLLSAFGYGDKGLASVYNSTGSVEAVGEELISGPYVNGSGAIVKVGFEVNPTLTSGGTGLMMKFNLTSGDVHELILTSSDGTDITPPASQVANGYITITSVVPEFSSVFFFALLMTATFGAALVSKTEWSRKRKEQDTVN